MKKALFISLLLISLAVPELNAQTRKRNFRQHEVGLFIGGSYYLGDLNPRKHFFLSQPAIGVLYRFTPNYRYAFRAGFNFGSVMGDDSQTGEPDQLQRNLNFKSNITEFHVMAEFNFLEYRISNAKHKFSPYLFLGIGVFHFKPRANYNNYWVDLQPLRTEGEAKRYKLTQVCIPFGIGIKMNVSKQVGLGLEWGPRKTFTDYIDDVSGVYPDPSKAFTTGHNMSTILSDRSKNAGNNIDKQRGNPVTKDWYFFFGLTLNIKINPQPPPCHAYDH